MNDRAMQVNERVAGVRLPVVLIGNQDTCGYFSSVAAGFRDLGCRAHFLDISPRASDDQPLPVVLRWYRGSYRSFQTSRELSRFSPFRYMATARLLLAQGALFAWMAVFVDVAIFKSGQSYSATSLDVRLLRFLGRRVAFFYVGSDSRPLYLAGVDPQTVDHEGVRRRVQEICMQLRRAEKMADVVIANPLSAQLHKKTLCIAQIIGSTLDPDKIGKARAVAPKEQHSASAPFRIIHAPSLASLKGTDRIRTAIETMRDKGYAIEYIEVSGRPNEEVLALIVSSDLVIDELYSDSYGGMLAHEACALGVPVLVGSCAASSLRDLFPDEAKVPSIFGTPDELEPMLERFLSDADFRVRAKVATQGYAERTTAKAVASRFLAVLEDRAPSDWYVNPAAICYVEGVGGPPENVAAIVREYVRRFGSSALMLDDKPVLRDRLLMFADATEILASPQFEAAE